MNFNEMIQSNELESQEINHTSSSSNLTNIGWGAIENLGILESNEHHINDVTEIGDGIFGMGGSLSNVPVKLFGLVMAPRGVYVLLFVVFVVVSES